MKKHVISTIIYLAIIGAAVYAIYTIITKLDAEITKLSEGNDNYAFTRRTSASEETEPPLGRPPIADDKPPHDVIVSPPAENSKLKDAVIYNGDLELPVNGATGFASVDIDMTANDNPSNITKLKAGTAFTVLKEQDDWWLICPDGITVGWVRHMFCMINLPDVIPSIVYNNTNAYSSVFRCYYQEEIDIPDVTGEQLYQYSDRKDGKAYNKRFDKNEYIVPVLYSMSKRIFKAQQYALENGDTLVIYEGFRPRDTQARVYNAVSNLMGKNANVRKGFGSWNVSMFIASGISNHQLGYAIDVSLASIMEKEDAVTGRYKYTNISRALEYSMPSPIHELSIKAAVFTHNVAIESFDAWKKGTFSEGMINHPKAQNLQKYCTDAGLTPLASEWWHFNDLHTLFNITKKSNGNFDIKECLSITPSN